MHLPESLAAWGTPGFEGALKRELERVGPGGLPLQQGLSAGSVALDERFEVMVIGSDADATGIRSKVGVFFSGIVAGCNCADDPSPVEAQAEYCELQIVIDRSTGLALASVC